MIGFGGLAAIQSTLSGVRAAARSSWGAPPATPPASWPQVEDVFRFSSFVPPDPLVEDAIAASRNAAPAADGKTATMIDQYRKWLRGAVGAGAGDGWMTLADAVRDGVDLGRYALLDAARMRSQEVGALLAPGDSAEPSYGSPEGLPASSAAWTIRGTIDSARARSAAPDAA